MHPDRVVRRRLPLAGRHVGWRSRKACGLVLQMKVAGLGWGHAAIYSMLGQPITCVSSAPTHGALGDLGLWVVLCQAEKVK